MRIPILFSLILLLSNNLSAQHCNSKGALLWVQKKQLQKAPQVFSANDKVSALVFSKSDENELLLELRCGQATDSIQFPLFSIEKRAKKLLKFSSLYKNYYFLELIPDYYPTLDYRYDSLSDLLFSSSLNLKTDSLLLHYKALALPTTEGCFTLHFDGDSKKMVSAKWHYDDRQYHKMLKKQMDSIQREIHCLDSARIKLWDHIQDYRDSLFAEQDLHEVIPDVDKDLLLPLIRSLTDINNMKESLISGVNQNTNRLEELKKKHEVLLKESLAKKNFTKIKHFWERYEKLSADRIDLFKELGLIQQQIVMLRSKLRELDLWNY